MVKKKFLLVMLTALLLGGCYVGPYGPEVSIGVYPGYYYGHSYYRHYYY